MTGCSVKTLNSLELASSVPSASRAKSITAHCRPEAEAEERDADARAPSGWRGSSLDAAVAEAARHEHAGDPRELLVDLPGSTRSRCSLRIQRTFTSTL